MQAVKVAQFLNFGFQFWIMVGVWVTGVHSNRQPVKSVLTEKERQIFDYTQKGDFVKTAELCNEGVQANIVHDGEEGYTPLHFAATIDKEIMITTLIKCGVYINAVDNKGHTPLHLAVRVKDHQTVDTLLFYGADPQIKNKEGITAYEMGKSCSKDKIRKSFELIRPAENKVRKLTKEESLLMLYVMDGLYQEVAVLCRDGVDAQVADIDAEENSALHIALNLKENFVEMVNTLRRCGADVNAKNDEGNTPLHMAIYSDSPDLKSVQLLLNKADPFILNKKGKSPYDLAMEKGNEALKKVFELGLKGWFRKGFMFG